MKKTYRPKAKLEVFYTGGPIQVSPNGDCFACACLQETKIVDHSSGAVLRTIPSDEELVTALCFIPDGKHLYVTSRSLIVRKWCLASGDCLATIKGHSAPISDIAVDSSGSIVAFGSADRTVTVHDIQGNFRTHTFKGHKSVVLKVVYHPTEAELVSCSQDNCLKVWDLHQSKLRTTLTGHNSAVTAAAFSEDGRFLVSAGRDNAVIVWSVKTYTKCAEFPVFESIEDMICMPMAFADQIAPRQQVKKRRHPCIVIACGGERGVMRMWRTDTGANVFSSSSEKGMTNAASEIVSLQQMSGPKRFLIARADCSIELTEIQDGSEAEGIKLTQSRFLMGNMDEIIDVAFVGSDASRIAVASNSPNIQVFDSNNLNCVSTLIGHSNAVLCIAMTSYKTRSILISGSKDQSVRVWDAATSHCLADSVGHAAAVTAVAASKRENKMLITVSADKIVKVWKLRMQLVGEALSVLKLKVASGTVAHSKEINCVDIAPNDSLIATGSTDKTIKLFEIPSLTVRATLHGHKRGVWCVQFSQTDKTLLSASADTLIKMWSLMDASCLRTFEGHSGSILKAVFISQSQQILSCGGDGLLKLWNVSNCECVSTFDEHEDRIWSIAFSGEHQEMMASGGSDSTLIIWHDTTEHDRETEIQQQQEELTKQQNLSNAIQLKDFQLAAKLAFDLQHSRKLLTLLKKNLPKQEHVCLFSAIVDLLVDDAAVMKCLEYVRDWNTNAKHCEEAQTLLRLILERYSPQRLAAIPGVSAILEAIESYTIRHFQRIEKLHEATYIVDFMLESMDVLTPDKIAEEEDTSELIEIDDDSAEEIQVDSVEATSNREAKRPKLEST